MFVSPLGFRHAQGHFKNYMVKIFIALFILLLSGTVQAQHTQAEPPGIQVAQINIYKIDSFRYDITYYDPTQFNGVEDVHYSIFKTVVINNENYVHYWIDQILKSIPGEATLRGKQLLPDSVQNQIMEYYFSRYSKHDNTKK